VGNASFSEAKFVFDAGLGFGAFRNWVYDPAASGRLAGRLALQRARAAAQLSYQQLLIAASDVRSSRVLGDLQHPLEELAERIIATEPMLNQRAKRLQVLRSIDVSIAALSRVLADHRVKVVYQAPSATQLASP
jgi:hypothetical protein